MMSMTIAIIMIRAVNPNDTEEAIWTFMCEARTKGIGFATARQHLLDIKRLDYISWTYQDYITSRSLGHVQVGLDILDVSRLDSISRTCQEYIIYL